MNFGVSSEYFWHPYVGFAAQPNCAALHTRPPNIFRFPTICIAQALKKTIVRLTALRCAQPYALEGMARRELQAAGGTLGQVQHSAQVEMSFTLSEPVAPRW
jgi:hypothetical protein